MLFQLQKKGETIRQRLSLPADASASSFDDCEDYEALGLLVQRKLGTP